MLLEESNNKGFTSSHRFIELSTHQLENCILSIEKKKDKRLKSVNKIVVAAGGVRLSRVVLTSDSQEMMQNKQHSHQTLCIAVSDITKTAFCHLKKKR